jgi:hypothetical protein
VYLRVAATELLLKPLPLRLSQHVSVTVNRVPVVSGVKEDDLHSAAGGAVTVSRIHAVLLPPAKSMSTTYYHIIFSIAKSISDLERNTRRALSADHLSRYQRETLKTEKPRLVIIGLYGSKCIIKSTKIWLVRFCYIAVA